mmetsp:Transcript_23138/g.71103  ORF Transcript_23138/g.71103 Transcript_23138/m.71103 type:complete len:244 (+) Transcript_23138:150-881(+)
MVRVPLVERGVGVVFPRSPGRQTRRRRRSEVVVGIFGERQPGCLVRDGRSTFGGRGAAAEGDGEASFLALSRLLEKIVALLPGQRFAAVGSPGHSRRRHTIVAAAEDLEVGHGRGLFGGHALLLLVAEARGRQLCGEDVRVLAVRGGVGVVRGFAEVGGLGGGALDALIGVEVDGPRGGVVRNDVEGSQRALGAARRRAHEPRHARRALAGAVPRRGPVGVGRDEVVLRREVRQRFAEQFAGG